MAQKRKSFAMSRSSASSGRLEAVQSAAEVAPDIGVRVNFGGFESNEPNEAATPRVLEQPAEKAGRGTHFILLG
jgi:hypothetical protein